MNQPFSIRHKEEVVGAFVLIAGAIFALLIIITLMRKDIFEERYILKAEYAMGVGLNPGAAVCIAGLNIGIIDNVELNRFGRVTLTFKIKKSHQPRIRRNSTATVMRLNPAVGDKFINISKGSPDFPALEDGDTIQTEDPVDLDDLLEHLTGTISSIDNIIQRLEKGEGTVGALLADRSVYEGINNILLSTKITARRGNHLIGDLQGITDKVSGTTDQIPGIIEQLSAALESVNALTQKADSLFFLINAILKESKPLIDISREKLDDADDIIASLKQNFIIRWNLPDLPKDELIYFGSRK